MLKLKDILEVVNGKLICGNINTKISRISLDSRDIKSGDLFIPIVGEKFDAHQFLSDVLKKNLSGILTEQDLEGCEGKFIVKVDDTTKAFGLLAGYYRDKFKIPLVGITGSVGKTSTKNIVAQALCNNFNLLKTEGNFNNEIGLPKTLFNLKKDHELAVVELGMSDLGEIQFLSEISKPDIAVITNIGLSHIETLGSKQNILKAKMEILEGLKPGGLLILNGDDPLLEGMKDLLDVRTVFYGMEEGVDYQAFNIETIGEKGVSFEIVINSKDYKVFVPLPGIHNVYNAMVSIIIGLEFKVPVEDIIKGIETIKPDDKRMKFINKNGIKIINDTYNASPPSMEAAIDVLKDIAAKRKVAVLADMLELGNYSGKAHYDIGKHAAEKSIDVILCVGNYSTNMANGAKENGMSENNCHSFSNKDSLKKFLDTFVQEGDAYLVKGSRGMAMEEIVQYLES